MSVNHSRLRLSSGNSPTITCDAHLNIYWAHAIVTGSLRICSRIDRGGGCPRAIAVRVFTQNSVFSHERNGCMTIGARFPFFLTTHGSDFCCARASGTLSFLISIHCSSRCCSSAVGNVSVVGKIPSTIGLGSLFGDGDVSIPRSKSNGACGGGECGNRSPPRENTLSMRLKFGANQRARICEDMWTVGLKNAVATTRCLLDFALR